MKKIYFLFLLTFLLSIQSRAQLPFFDGFESGGFIAGGWAVSGNTVISTQSPATGSYCAEGPSTYGLLKNFPSITQNFNSLEFDIRMAQTNTVSLVFRIKDAIGNTSGGIIVNDMGQIVGVNGGGGNLVNLLTYLTQTWYHIKMDFDMSTQKYDIYIDNQLVANDFDFYTANFTTPYDFSWSSIALSGSIWIDNVNIIGGTSGIKENMANQLFTYSDASGQLTILNLPLKETYDWELFNTAGVLSSSGILAGGNRTIDASQFAPGLYFLHVNSRHGKSFYLKVMVK